MNKQGKSKNTGFVIQGIILASAGIIVRIIGILYRIPMYEILGDEGMGLYSYAFEIYNIARLLSSYSLPLAVAKLVSARADIGERTNSYRVLKISTLAAVVIGGIVAIIVFFGAEFLAGTIMKAPMSTYALQVLAPCLFIVSILGVLRGFCQGMGTTVPTAASQIIEQIANAIVSIAASAMLMKVGLEVAASEGIDSLAYAYGAAGGTLGTVMGAFFALVFMGIVIFSYKKIIKRQIAREPHVKKESYMSLLRTLMVIAIPVIFSTAIYNINSILDQGIYNNIMAMQGYLEEEYISLWGMYTGKYKVLQNVPISVANSFAVSVIPSLTIAVVARKQSEIKEKIEMAIRLSALIAIPSFVGFLIFAKPILDLLFSGDNQISANILMIGSVAVVCYCLSTVTNGILQGLNKMSLPIKNASISLAIHLVFLVGLMLIFDLHIYAVVISSTIFALSMCILNARDIKRYAGYRQEWKKTFILPFLSSVIMGVMSYGVYYLLQLVINANVALIFAIGVAVVVYAVALVFTKALTEEELRTMPKGHQFVRLFKKVRLM